MLKQTIANNIRNIREQKEYLQKDIASAIGISRTAYTEIENAKSSMNVEILYKIIVALQCDITDIMPPIGSIKPKLRIPIIRRDTVYQYSKEGIYIKAYKSLYEAEQKTGVNRGSILGCINGKTRMAGNFIWKNNN